jgi:hypothetical protein
MIKFIRSMFVSSQVHAKVAFIRGDLSNGRSDRPGVWYKA